MDRKLHFGFSERLNSLLGIYKSLVVVVEPVDMWITGLTTCYCWQILRITQGITRVDRSKKFGITRFGREITTLFTRFQQVTVDNF